MLQLTDLNRDYEEFLQLRNKRTVNQKNDKTYELTIHSDRQKFINYVKSWQGYGIFLCIFAHCQWEYNWAQLLEQFGNIQLG